MNPAAPTRKTRRGFTAIRIRPLRPADLEIVEAISEESPEAAAWSREAYLASCDARTPNSVSSHFGRVAEVDSDVQGFAVARLAADEVEILNLAVSPLARRSGIASRLLDFILEEAQAKGARKAFLEVRESNRPARAFYARHGFLEAGRRRGYYSRPAEDALILCRIGTQL